jgi:peptidyl-tRNA hydrolase
MKKVKILVRKNLRLSRGKMAAQAVHAALDLVSLGFIDVDSYKGLPVIVLEVSDKKFEENKARKLISIFDAGYTEVKPGTETCLAYLEDENETMGG